MRTVEELTQLLDPVVKSIGYELLCVEFDAHARSAVLRLFIDAPAGIGVEDCERVSREVAATLDVEDPIRQAYHLEVSSPGLDRPLVKPEHYLRFRGSEVRVQLMAPLDGRRKFKGTLLALEDGMVSLQTPQGAVRLPLAGVEKTRLVPNLETERAG